MPEFKTIDDVVAAGTTVTYSCYARCVRVVSASAPFTLATDDGSPGWIDAGMALRSEKPVTRVRVTAGAANLTLRLALYEGDIDDSRMAGTVSAAVVPGATYRSTADLAVVAGAAAVAVFAADSARKTAIISNTGAGACRIGDAGTGAAEGLYLASGETLFLDTTGAIYVYSAAGCTLARAEIVS